MKKSKIKSTQLYIKKIQVVYLLLLSNILLSLTSCQTHQIKFKKENQVALYKTKTLYREPENKLSQVVYSDFTIIKGKYLKLNVYTHLTGPLVSFALSKNKLKAIFYKEKKFYNGKFDGLVIEKFIRVKNLTVTDFIHVFDELEACEKQKHFVKCKLAENLEKRIYYAKDKIIKVVLNSKIPFREITFFVNSVEDQTVSKKSIELNIPESFQEMKL